VAPVRGVNRIEGLGGTAEAMPFHSWARRNFNPFTQTTMKRKKARVRINPPRWVEHEKD